MDGTVKIKVEGGIYAEAELELALEDLSIGGTLQDDVIVLPLPERALRIEGVESGTPRLVICAEGFEQGRQAAGLASEPEDDTGSDAANQLEAGDSEPLRGHHVLRHASGLTISIFAPGDEQASSAGDSDHIGEAPVMQASAARSTGIPMGIWGLAIVAVLSISVIGMVLYRAGDDVPQMAQALPVDITATSQSETEPAFELAQNPQQAPVSAEPAQAGFALPAKLAQVAMLLPTALDPKEGLTPFGGATAVPFPAGLPEAPAKHREEARIPKDWAPEAMQHMAPADHTIEAPQEQAIRFLAKRLEENNLSGIKLISEEHALRAQGSHLATSRTVWHNIQSEYDVAWSRQVPLVVDTKEVAPEIPFRVRSVWLGSEPQLITVRGEHFKIGDQTSEKWQIRKITADHVLLERNGITMSVAVR